MTKEHISYIKKTSNLHDKIYHFKKHHRKSGNIIHYLDLISKTKDLDFIKSKLWPAFKKPFFQQFPGEAIGTVEHGEDGYYHIHCAVAFDHPPMIHYAELEAVRRWLMVNAAYTGNKLSKKHAVSLVEENTNLGDAKARYIAKLQKYQAGRRPFYPKPHGQPGSFTLTHNVKGKGYWTERDLPTWKYSTPVMERKLKERLAKGVFYMQPL